MRVKKTWKFKKKLEAMVFKIMTCWPLLNFSAVFKNRIKSWILNTQLGKWI